jgi:cysteine synthase A
MIDTIEEVDSPASYQLSLLLSREGLICGPSSGFALEGLYRFLRKHKEAGTLQHLGGKDGNIHCAFICCDLPYQYLGDYFIKLGDENFPPITNKVSLSQ